MHVILVTAEMQHNVTFNSHSYTNKWFKRLIWLNDWFNQWFKRTSSDLLRPVWRIHHHRLPKTVIHIGRHGFQNNRTQQLSEIIQRESHKWLINGTLMFLYSSSCRREPVPRPQPKPGSFLLSLVPIKQDQSAFPVPAAGASAVSWQATFVLMKGFCREAVRLCFTQTSAFFSIPFVPCSLFHLLQFSILKQRAIHAFGDCPF